MYNSEMETRAKAQGKPLKKPGAYDTDKYFQEADAGYGDVGVDQEPDAGAVDDPTDREFKPSSRAIKAAKEEAAVADQGIAEAGGVEAVRAEAQELKDTPVGEPDVDRAGEPVPILEGGEDVADEEVVERAM